MENKELQLQDKMRYAQPNQNMYPYYYPIVPLDEVFVRLHPVFPKVRDIYWVSNYGRVYNENSGYLLGEGDDKGYITYSLLRNPDYQTDAVGISLKCQAQILVALAFIGPKPSPIHQVNHIDCNPHNNYYTNLEWVTPAENLEHSRRLGHYHNPDGTYKHHTYPKETIIQICELMQDGILSPTVISRKVFGCEPTPSIFGLIQSIRSKSNWTFVSNDFNIPDLDHRNFVSDEFITRVCELFQSIPSSMDWPHADILINVGINPDILSKDVLHRFKSAISQIKKRKAYARIVSQYTF